MIYADNAATTKLDEDAFYKMRPFLLEEYANASEPFRMFRNKKTAPNLLQFETANYKVFSCYSASGSPR